MKKRVIHVLKLIGVGVAFLFIVFGIATWVVFERKNDWVLDRIQAFMNESQSGQLEMTGIDLKLFRSLTNITIELDSIKYFEHRDSLRNGQEQPILQADKLFASFDLWALINDELKVSEISLVDTKLNVVEYENGDLNINHALKPPGNAKPKTASKAIGTRPLSASFIFTSSRSGSPTTEPVPEDKIVPAMQVDLQFISLNNLLLTWKTFASPAPSVILMKTWEANLITNGSVLNTQLSATGNVQTLVVNGVKVPAGDLSMNADIRFEKEIQKITILSSKINYNILQASLQGTYSLKKGHRLDLQLDASSNNLALLSMLFKPAVIRQNPNLLKKGDIYLRGTVSGELENHSPQFDITFGVKDLVLHLPNKMGSFQDIGFEGSVTSGSASDYSGAKFEIRYLKGLVPGGFLKGKFALNNFVEPYINYRLGAQLKLDGFDQIFKIDMVRNLNGTVAFNANYDGPLNLLTKHKMDSSRSSTITMKDVSFIVARTNKLVSGLSGRIENKDNQATIQQLAFTYGKNDVEVNATVDNLLYLLLNHEQNIVASGNIRSNQVHTRDFILDTLLEAHVQDRISNLSFDFMVETTGSKSSDKSFLPDIAFDIRNLSAKFEKLPNIELLNTRGLFSESLHGLRLELYEFHANMTHGQIDVTGDLLIPSNQLWEFNARVKADKFPWTYVRELVAEIRDGAEPSAKNLPLKEMDIVNSDLDLSAVVITYPFDINKLNLRNSRIAYIFPDSKSVSVDKLNLSLDHFAFKHSKDSSSLTGLISTKGTMDLVQFKVPGLDEFDASLSITGEDNQLDMSFTRDTHTAKSEVGELSIDISKKEPNYHLQLDVKRSSLERFIRKFSQTRLMEGDINYKLDLNAAGSNWSTIKENMEGDIEISGDSLKFYGIDIDDVLKKFNKSQNFNLADLGAVVIAGPVGLAVTKGSDFVSLAAVNLDSIHQTNIKTLLAKWKLENLQLTTQDVAIATYTSRIAFEGQIDLGRDSIPGFNIAVVDKNGCSLMDQKLYGKIGALQQGKLNITKTLFGSVVNFVNAVVGKDCKPVYVGKVKDPLH